MRCRELVKILRLRYVLPLFTVTHWTAIMSDDFFSAVITSRGTHAREKSGSREQRRKARVTTGTHKPNTTTTVLKCYTWEQVSTATFEGRKAGIL
jgi:hypothetical protein